MTFVGYSTDIRYKSQLVVDFCSIYCYNVDRYAYYFKGNYMETDKNLPNFSDKQLEEIKLGEASKVDISIYARPEYNWLQMEQIRLGLEEGIDVIGYANPEYSHETMKQIRLSCLSQVDLIPFLKQNFTDRELEEIRISLEENLPIAMWLDTDMFAQQIREIRLGLEEGLDVGIYADITYNWLQMQEIRKGLEERLDVTVYAKPLMEYRQMQEVRFGLEAGLNVEEYTNLTFTAKDMHLKRLAMLKEQKEAGLSHQALVLEKDNQEHQQLDISIMLEDNATKHPFHEAGVYYIQEASAMAPASCLQAQPGEMILDLCAAPGGKSTQIAAAMQGKGILICNEIHPGRAKILSENIERMGIANAIVLNHEPAVLANRFVACFDKIMVDAPCSGEGMFRKNEEAVNEWSLENVEMCARRQDDILDSAAAMLKPGGRMVYSTCTFAPLEDEGTIERFVTRHPEFVVEEMKRLWPHKVEGEGHFVASLCKAGENNSIGCSHWTVQKTTKEKECSQWKEFQQEYIYKELNGILLKFGEQLYLAPDHCPDLSGLKVLRPGLHLGTLKKDRFEPSHALALTLHPEDAKLTADLSVEKAISYIEGQTLQLTGDKGWYVITVEGYSLGWGKLAGEVMKNHYPKGLRKLLRA